MNSTDKAREIAEILEGVVAGVLDGGRALDRGPDLETESDRLLTSAWHHLQHFVDDADIRRRDLEYAQSQRGVLLRYAREIGAAYRIGTFAS